VTISSSLTSLKIPSKKDNKIALWTFSSSAFSLMLLMAPHSPKSLPSLVVLTKHASSCAKD
jgi:hypothetical protein